MNAILKVLVSKIVVHDDHLEFWACLEDGEIPPGADCHDEDGQFLIHPFDPRYTPSDFGRLELGEGGSITPVEVWSAGGHVSRFLESYSECWWGFFVRPRRTHSEPESKSAVTSLLDYEM
jgi:hypothetical protein